MTALIALALASVAANANRSLSISPGRSVSAAGSLTFSGEEGESLFTCNVTLLKTLSTALPKSFTILIGHVTGVAIDLGRRDAGEHCRVNGLVTRVNDLIALRESAGALETHARCTLEGATGVELCDVTGGESRLWKLTISGFNGTLPNIAGFIIQIERMQFKLEFNILGANQRCLYRGSTNNSVPIERGAFSRLSFSATRFALQSSLSELCPATVLATGSFTLSPTQTVTLL